jgi:prolyl-tRNA synthetase
MKDSYSFDVDEEALDHSYKLHEEAYRKIFKRCGLDSYQVESDPGMMGGAMAHEFMAPSPVGEDVVVLCDSCGYAANVELARSVSPKPEFGDWDFEEVHTPKKRTVEEVSEFMGLKPEHFIKSLLLMTNKGPVLALVRGDQELHDKKTQRVLGPFRTALKEEIKETLGVEAGFIGPMDHKLRVVADLDLKEGIYASGANREDFHAKGIRPGVHFEAEWHDLHVAKDGEGCPNCGAPVRTEKCIEVGNIFKLGTKYSVPLKANYLDEAGSERPIVMGSYGIGPARIAAAAVEQSHDEDGIIWPGSISPFDVQMLPLNMADEDTVRVADELYSAFNEAGLEVLVDDREERAGVKFKDADLIGIPKRVVIGERNLKEGLVEVKDRRTKETVKVKPEEVLTTLREWKK